MKTKIFLLSLLFVGLLAAAATLPGKNSNSKATKTFKTPDAFFDFIRAHRQGKGVTVTWGSSASSSMVNCFTVIRTYEDPLDPYSEWTPVCNMPCNASRSYKNTDDNVSPGFASYRVVASLTVGGYAFSDVETIHIVQH